MTSQIKAIIFDFGGVLVDWNPRNLYRHFFSTPQEIEEFFAEVNFMEWNAQQDKGRPFAEGVEALSKEFPHRAHLISAFHKRWEETVTGGITETIEILQTLKQKEYPLYGLSNWSAETFSIVRHQFEFFNLFDEIILSGEVKLIKPDPAIYELCLQKIGKPANECLFIDDAPVNIETAYQMGFDTIRFISPQLLKGQLRARKII